MHPAFSIIVFTTAAGAGYGLLAVLGLLAPAGLLPQGRAFGVVALALALGLVAVGLLASLAHLGRPERAWRALSQWRSSWLSREGVAALATFVPAGLFGLAWMAAGAPDGGTGRLAGWLAAAMAAVTVACTAMIYASLPTVRQWHDARVPPLYLALSAMTGLILAGALAALFGGATDGLALAAAVSVAVAWALKESYWRAVADGRPGVSAEEATGLGRLGRVRSLEAPHTEANYLLKEMGFAVGRRHAATLRTVARLAGFAAPLALTVTAWLAGGGPVATAALLLAVPAAALGVVVERWLFFAEARHTVIVYYRDAAAA
ncbi:dimethyl sulfoxide reductase anchor subunit family protein [Azospirillum sp. ST 5-10]|uniref:dimethyl sulfoxide reductase anchor subunit family protein n=1 Tax=unclassified Azospirillum TaxID=2630922 RepID=UPI003F49B548